MIHRGQVSFGGGRDNNVGRLLPCNCRCRWNTSAATTTITKKLIYRAEVGDVIVKNNQIVEGELGH